MCFIFFLLIVAGGVAVAAAAAAVVNMHHYACTRPQMKTSLRLPALKVKSKKRKFFFSSFIPLVESSTTLLPLSCRLDSLKACYQLILLLLHDDQANMLLWWCCWLAGDRRLH